MSRLEPFRRLPLKALHRFANLPQDEHRVFLAVRNSEQRCARQGLELLIHDAQTLSSFEVGAEFFEDSALSRLTFDSIVRGLWFPEIFQVRHKYSPPSQYCFNFSPNVYFN